MIRLGSTLLVLAILSIPALGQERVVLDAVKEIKSLEGKEEKLAADDKSGAEKLLRRMKIVTLKLDSARDKTHASYVDAKKRFDDLNAALYARMNEKPPVPGEGGDVDFEALNDLNDEIRESFRKLRGMRINDISTPQLVKPWRDAIADYRKRLGEFPSGDENVRKVKRNIDDMEATLEAGLKQLETNAKAAEVQARLDAITAKYQKANMPPMLQEPLEPEFVEGWAKGIVHRLEVEQPQDIAAINEIGKDPNVDSQKLSSALYWVGNNGKQVLEETLAGGLQLVNAKVIEGERIADFILETNPDDENHVLNRLLREGSLEHYTAELQKGLESIAIARAFDAGLGKRAEANRDAQKAKLDRALDHYRACIVKALDQVRMPKAKSTNEELLKIATQELKESKEKVTEFERMVVTSDLATREKRQGSIERGMSSATVTVYHYVWQEFTVQTAEKVGDDYYIFINKFRRYSKGGERTRLNEWMLYDRFKSTQILKENIAK